MRRRRAISKAAAVLSGLAILVWAPNAFAFGLQNVSGAPADLHAGAHSNINVHIGIQQPGVPSTPGDQIRDLTVHLPPGLVGDPTGPATCTEAQLNANSCPAESKVGTSGSSVLVAGLVPLDVPGSIYNVVPHAGEPARFGIVLSPPAGAPVVLQSPAQLRPDFGLDTVLNGLPNTASGLPIYITALDISLFGTANGEPFMRNPTSCDAKTVSFDAVSYADQAVSGSAPSFTPTDCDALPFSPELTAELGAPGETDFATHPPLETVIKQDGAEAGLKRAEVILPASTQPNNDALSSQCTEAQFDAGSCPAGTDIGTAEASSPLLTVPLTGTAYLLDIDGGLGVGLDLQGPLALKLKGNFVFSPDFRTGNLFEGLPDIPISEFTLNLAGGADGVLFAARDLCDPPPSTLDATFDGHNGAHLVQAADATIVGCGPPAPPTAKVHLRKPHSSAPELDLDVDAGSEPVEKVQLKLPKRFKLAKGDAFTDGTKAIVDGNAVSDSILTRKQRKLVADPSAADDSVDLRLHDGALRQAGGRGKRFTVKVTDGDDQAFSFKLKP